MKIKNFSKGILCVIGCFIFTTFSNAQTNNQFPDKEKLNELILKKDSIFWKAYNTCDLTVFGTFLAEDLEFYHDKGGLTVGGNKLITMMQNGLCGSEIPQLRREAVKGTIAVYPINDFGAIISGEHLFYLRQQEKPEQLIEKAKFTHLWHLKDGEWRMSRVFSYDHQKTSVNDTKKVKRISKVELESYTGNYKAPKTGDVKILLNEDANLEINAGEMNAVMHAETTNLFFLKEAPLTFEFVKDSNEKVVKFIVRENGKIVEEAIKL
ncbi:nuclear transport factor 2 family protein [Flavobacteriaceae bacterium M23B6Z8]